ncbi:plexin domain-containing protein 2-like isoform X2 [Ptychodera flava]|uniref:plexin domain-containing protein 2-like isoform X2 n=1 Tax=Ptychodera flava TaxID=63121 RepID=UPI00396A9039
MAVKHCDSFQVVLILAVIAAVFSLSNKQQDLGDEYTFLMSGEQHSMQNGIADINFDAEKDYLTRFKRDTADGSSTMPPEVIEVLDHHTYYTSRFITQGDDLWVDLDRRGTEHGKLSDRHLTAVATDLSFTFPYYGHNLSSVVMATGGFLYVGSFMHKWLTVTQYIAPLMGNFNPSANDTATIRFLDTGSSFTCEWNRVQLHDQANVGTFTFQVTLKKNGTIVLAYRDIPIPVSQIKDKSHPVKVGVADAFYVDEQIYKNYYRRTIYEYHDVALNKSFVASRTAFILEPLPTCNQMRSCNSCVEANIGFQCGWCHKVKKCSSGFDRHRQDWLQAGCDEKIGEVRCTEVQPQASKGPDIGVGAIIAILILILLLTAAGGIIIFAYINPTSRPGLFLISLRYCCRKDETSGSGDNSDKYAVTMDQDNPTIEPTAPPVIPHHESDVSHA